MLLAVLLIIILSGIVIFDQLRLKRLEDALERVNILSYEGDSLVIYHPLNLEDENVFISP